jgi:hypothetical protein
MLDKTHTPHYHLGFTRRIAVRAWLQVAHGRTHRVKNHGQVKLFWTCEMNSPVLSAIPGCLRQARGEWKDAGGPK